MGSEQLIPLLEYGVVVGQKEHTVEPLFEAIELGYVFNPRQDHVQLVLASLGVYLPSMQFIHKVEAVMLS